MSVLTIWCSQAKSRGINVPSVAKLFRTKARRKDIVSENRSGLNVEGDSLLTPAPWSALLRPCIFTLSFSGASLSVCALWQYENMRSGALKSRIPKLDIFNQRKAGEFREKTRRWWASLSDGEKLFWPIFGCNLLVWGCWRVPVLQPTMMRLFMTNPAVKSSSISLLLSVFSHHSFLHLAANMYVLHSFMPPAVHLLGKEQFLAVYLSSGVVSSLASMIHKVAVGSTAYSLGASGAICCVLGMFGSYVPEARMQIIFLPMITFSAATALKGLMVLDTAGLVMKWRLFDHAAHLSGVLAGLGWAYYGNAYLWGKREGLVTAWHGWRTGDR